MQAVSAELFATHSELQALLKSDVVAETGTNDDNDDDNNNAKNKLPALYDDNEVPLSHDMANDDYIIFGPHKVSKFDVTRLERNMFANADILNAYISSLASNDNGVSFIRLALLTF